MLFKVEMTVAIPHDLAPEKAAELKATEKARAQELQRSGQWRHLWRVAGRYANVSIFDVDSVEELHEILSTLPLFPFMEMTVTPLCRHPSSAWDDDR
jgi:muconolactone D-isomerase